jgi:hypothetical protein
VAALIAAVAVAVTLLVWRPWDPVPDELRAAERDVSRLPGVVGVTTDYTVTGEDPLATVTAHSTVTVRLDDALDPPPPRAGAGGGGGGGGPPPGAPPPPAPRPGGGGGGPPAPGARGGVPPGRGGPARAAARPRRGRGAGGGRGRRRSSTPSGCPAPN